MVDSVVVLLEISHILSFSRFREQGKVLGGTKGNVVLEFISGAPAKEFVIDEIPNVFDYDQLVKYGYTVSSNGIRN